MKQKNSLSSGIIISFGLRVAAWVALFGLSFGSGGSFPAVVAIWAGYKIIVLVFRLFGLAVRVFFTAVSIVVLIAILSLITF